jgi:hypothetical protein
MQVLKPLTFTIDEVCHLAKGWETLLQERLSPGVCQIYGDYIVAHFLQCLFALFTVCTCHTWSVTWPKKKELLNATMNCIQEHNNCFF